MFSVFARTIWIKVIEMHLTQAFQMSFNVVCLFWLVIIPIKRKQNPKLQNITDLHKSKYITYNRCKTIGCAMFFTDHVNLKLGMYKFYYHCNARYKTESKLNFLLDNYMFFYVSISRNVININYSISNQIWCKQG